MIKFFKFQELQCFFKMHNKILLIKTNLINNNNRIKIKILINLQKYIQIIKMYLIKKKII
jgi:hypothetical protein